MIINYPDWFRVEKDSAKIILQLSSIRDLAYYLRSPEQFIRQLALLRVGQLKLKEGISYLSEIIENHDESPENRELAAWSIKAISVRWGENFYINNRLLTHFTGEETLEDILGHIEIKDAEFPLNISFDFPQNNSPDILKSCIDFSSDFIIDEPFPWKRWLISLFTAAIAGSFDIYKLVKTSPEKIFSNLNKLFISKCKALKKLRLLPAFFSLPLMAAKYYKFLIFLLAAALIILVLNVPSLREPIQKNTSIKVAWVTQLIRSLSSEFLAMVSEGASDLLNTQGQSPNVPKTDVLLPKLPSSFFIVTAKNGLSLRLKPKDSSPRISALMKYQTKVTYHGTEATDSNGIKWYKIETQDGKSGWANSKWLKEWR